MGECCIVTLTILLIAAAAIAYFVFRGQAQRRNRAVERASEDAVRRRNAGGDGGPVLMIGDSDGGRRGADRDGDRGRDGDGDRGDSGSDGGGDGGGGGGD